MGREGSVSLSPLYQTTAVAHTFPSKVKTVCWVTTALLARSDRSLGSEPMSSDLVMPNRGHSSFGDMWWLCVAREKEDSFVTCTQLYTRNPVSTAEFLVRPFPALSGSYICMSAHLPPGP